MSRPDSYDAGLYARGGGGTAVPWEETAPACASASAPTKPSREIARARTADRAAGETAGKSVVKGTAAAPRAGPRRKGDSPPAPGCKEMPSTRTNAKAASWFRSPEIDAVSNETRSHACARPAPEPTGTCPDPSCSPPSARRPAKVRRSQTGERIKSSKSNYRVDPTGGASSTLLYAGTAPSFPRTEEDR